MEPGPAATVAHDPEVDAAGWTTVRLTMPAQGADDDGFVTVSLVM
jgi:hypothetical protein